MNPMKLLQLKSHWDKFNQNHPRFTPFIKAVSVNGMQEGTVIEVSVTTPDGRNFTTNLKVCEDDLKMVEAIKEMN
ncbi:MAG: hypothetical protein PUF12_03605 [Thermoflexaceae bacterium]|nr:hypothetical protein [Thermoflexaceae bacterium]